MDCNPVLGKWRQEDPWSSRQPTGLISELQAIETVSEGGMGDS